MKIKRSGPTPAQPAPPPAAQRPAPAQQAAPRRKSGALYWVALAFFALLFIVSAALLGRRLWEDHEVRSDFADLEALIEPAAPAADDGAQSDNAARFAALVARKPGFHRLDQHRRHQPELPGHVQPRRTGLLPAP